MLPSHEMVTQEMKSTCEYFAGGFLSDNTPSIVLIKSSDPFYQKMVYVNARGHDKSPTELVDEISNIISIDSSKIQIEVFSPHCMIDGARL